MSEYEGQQPPPQQPTPQQPPPQPPAPQPEWQPQPVQQPVQQPAPPADTWQQAPPAQQQWPQQPAAPLRPSQTGQVPAAAIAAAKAEPSGVAGMFNDPSELAATGLIAAGLFAIVAGLISFFNDPGLGADFTVRLLALTDTVDVGDVALLGIAVALLLLTPDPPGGMGRPMLLNVATALSAIIAAFGVIRAIVILTGNAAAIGRLASFIATLGVAIAAATVSFYAAKESFLKSEADNTSA